MKWTTKETFSPDGTQLQVEMRLCIDEIRLKVREVAAQGGGTIDVFAGERKVQEVVVLPNGSFLVNEIRP